MDAESLEALCEAGTSQMQIKMPFDIDITRYSSFDALVHVSAFCLRFAQKLKNKTANSGPLTVTELSNAKMLWLQHMQLKYNINNKSSIVSKLQLFIDSNNL